MLAELVKIFGDEFIPGHIAEYSQALITGGIGIGKTTIASVVLTYMACCTLCLKDPQDYYDLLPGSAIAFMQMSTKASQALDVIFHDTKSRIDNSPWFRDRYPRNKALKNKIEFTDKNINIIPGDSLETTFEGYNVLGGVLDEMDSHKKTLTKDYAEAGYSTIHARITSRFGDRGFLLLIGQMKSEGGFAQRKYNEFMGRADTYAIKLAIWDSLDADKFCGEKFYYDQLRSRIIHVDEVAKTGITTDGLLEIPIEYLRDFEVDPDKALRDLAGIPPKVSDPFIRNVDKIFAARSRYDAARFGVQPWIKGGLNPMLRCQDGLKRYGHIDIAYSAESGDCAGIAIGHVTGVVETEEGPKPFIVIDLIARLRPPSGRQLEISEIRQVMYDMQARGFRIKKVTLDGFQSTDTMQMFRKRHIESDLLSVDKLMLPYQDLRDAIYEERIEIPGVFDLHKRADVRECDVIVKELSELGYTPTGQKVDHPPGGTKDCSDALAGVVHNLMMSGRWNRVSAGPRSSQPRTTTQASGAVAHVLGGRNLDDLHAPQIPNWREGIPSSPWA
ncbi:MAG: hypothetical protein M3O41_14295 [Pseudomonadota bacterium]|nr:hypothetical protein [Pseudomonadota bacterium]